MPIDPIALQVRPAEINSPLQNLGQVMQLRNMAQQGQAQQQSLEEGELAIQQKRQALKDQQAMTAAMQEWDGQDPNQLTGLVMKHGASAQAVMGLKKSLLDQKEQYSKIAKDDAETGKNQLESLAKRNDMVAGQVATVLQLPDDQLPQAVAQAGQQMVQAGLLDQAHAQTIQQLSQLDPQTLRQKLTLFGKGLMSQSQQMAQAKDQAQIGKDTAQAGEANAATQAKQAELVGRYMGNATSQTAWDMARMTLKQNGVPDSLLSQLPQQYSPQAAKQAASIGMTPEQRLSAGFRQQEIGIQGGRLAEEKRHNAATEGSLSPEAIDMAATQFATTGQLPQQIGRNRNAASLIMNRAAQLQPNLDIASNAAAYKANAESLKKLQSNLDSVTAFENTANKNLDLFVNQAGKLVDTGSPLLNAPIRTVQEKAAGNPDVAAAMAARQVAVNEIAKVTGSPGLTGQLSDSARKEVSDFNPANATLQQTLAVAKVLRQDMANRHESYVQQIQAIQQRIKPNKPGAPAQQQSGGIWGEVPGAVKH